ncbi:MAG: hypothetical protein ACRDOY_10630 [Nocardioidaceae bacterium]
MHSRSAPSPGGPGSRLVAVVSVAVMALSAAVLVAAVREYRWASEAPTAGGSAGASANSSAGDSTASPGRFASERRGGSADDVPTSPGGDRAPAGGPPSWRRVLAGLDALRAQAYAASEPRLLRRVYTPGSPALRADQRLLRRYQRRGLRVIRLRLQVTDLQVRARRGASLVLRVRDRVSDGVVLGGPTRRRLPADEFDTRTISMRRVAGEWRVSAVRPR